MINRRRLKSSPRKRTYPVQQGDENVMKIDLHCHCKHSKRPTLWLMKKLGCPESFTEPIDLYHICRERGMDMVTITDHNVIDGCLEIADLPNTFMGCEYTTYFPQDRCKVHVLAYGMTEAQHKEITEARENIFDLVRYFDDHNIKHICAHPLFWVNDRLTIDHIEQLLLLFKNWELNGDMAPKMNKIARALVNGLTPGLMGELADKHDIDPHYAEPWNKNLTCGSDDHCSLNLARAYTEVPNATNLDEFWTGVEEGLGKLRSPDATPQGFARNVYSIGYQFYKDRFGLERYIQKDLLLGFLDQAFQQRVERERRWQDKVTLFFRKRRKPKSPAANATLISMARYEAEKLIREDPQLEAIVKDGRTHSSDLDLTTFEFVNQVSNRVLLQFGSHLLSKAVKGQIFDIFHSIGSAGALYLLMSPYFAAYSLHTRERTWSAEVIEKILGAGAADKYAIETKVGHFTDTYDEVNGVARTLRKQLATAQSLNKPYDIVACSPEGPSFERGVARFMPVGNIRLPEYPELKLLTPPFLQMLSHCYEEGYTHLHAATPGPVGLAALGIARILQLPISGTYHTAIPQYAKFLTGDRYVEDLMWRYMVWFYDQMDIVYVPSAATGDELIDRGIAREKIKVYPRGVDTERFHPSKKSDTFETKYGIGKDEVKLFYVGRVSKEKNLHILEQAYRALIGRGVEARLIVVGDGPYRGGMESALADTPAVFTGYVEGEDLAAMYASADCLVFPSTTDTFGNVVLESQASGVPVIVTDQGGPQENLLPGETGVIVGSNSVAELADAMEMMATDHVKRRAMGKAARAYMETRSFEAAFEQLWAMYTDETVHIDDDSAGEAMEKVEEAVRAIAL